MDGFNRFNNRNQPNQTAFFYEDDIFALLELDANEWYVSLQRVCAILGLDATEEAQHLQHQQLLSAGVRGTGSSTSLRADLLPLWLTMLPADQIASSVRPQLQAFQREAASALWQAFKPQGFGPEDTLVPERASMTPADRAYQGAMGEAALARQQMLIERQLERRESDGNRMPSAEPSDRTSTAFELARAVRRVAHTLSARSRRNEYGGVFRGLYHQFGISGYRRMPRGRLHEAMEWLERWHSDMLGEPEPPPDI
jgi:hypothetical protein